MRRNRKRKSGYEKGEQRRKDEKEEKREELKWNESMKSSKMVMLEGRR